MALALLADGFNEAIYPRYIVLGYKLFFGTRFETETEKLIFKILNLKKSLVIPYMQSNWKGHFFKLLLKANKIL